MFSVEAVLVGVVLIPIRPWPWSSTTPYPQQFLLQDGPMNVQRKMTSLRIVTRNSGISLNHSYTIKDCLWQVYRNKISIQDLDAMTKTSVGGLTFASNQHFLFDLTRWETFIILVTVLQVVKNFVLKVYRHDSSLIKFVVGAKLS